MAQRLRLKPIVKIIIVIVIILIIAIIAFVKIRKEWLYKQTYDYKLINKGYTEKEITLLEKYYNEDELYILATKDKDEDLLTLLGSKHYKSKNYDRYIAYMKSHKKASIDEVVHLVNINRDFEFYEKTSIADQSKGNLILVNKYYKFEKNYVPSDLVTISTKYCWGSGKQIKEEVYNAFIEMWKAANTENENIYLMINLAYRSYEDQETLYNKYKDLYNIDYADEVTARPGHSEHQTGLALDIFELKNSNYKTFSNTEACTWLKENAYKYGFILRYEESAKDITGFEAEDWHYRYVGKEAATIIHNKNITLEEYYYNEY